MTEDKVMSTPGETFDANFEIRQIRIRRAEARRTRYRKSRLDKYHAELTSMRRAGASLAELAYWLWWKHRCRVHRSSIDRFLKRWERLAAETVVDSEDDGREDYA